MKPMTPLPREGVVFPGLAPRLLRPGPESLAQYRASGGYAPLRDPAGLLAVVDQSGLLGRGGAAFPLAVKLRSVRGRGVAPVVVANGEEGEPASMKDRWLLRNRPHLVLDGLRLAAGIVGAARSVIYLSDGPAAGSMAVAGAEADQAVEVVEVSPAYIAGEETAAVRVLNGGPAKPSDKPPRPFESGVDGRPTLVCNVETLANLPFLLRHGSHAFRSEGTPASPGTFLATVNGADKPSALYELPHGVAVTEVLALHGVESGDVHGALLGGYFAGLVNSRVQDLTLDHETLRRFDTALGCGAISVLTAEDCPVAVGASVLAYFARENAGQCGSCFNGTAAMSVVAEALRDGLAQQADLDRLTRWSVVLRGRGACGTLDGAANVAASLRREFPDAVDKHLGSACRICAETPFRAERPFEAAPSKAVPA